MWYCSKKCARTHLRSCSGPVQDQLMPVAQQAPESQIADPAGESLVEQLDFYHFI